MAIKRINRYIILLGANNAIKFYWYTSTPSKSAVTSTPIRLVKSGKMDFLTIRKLSDDKMSEADSIASTEQLDDVQIEQLMLESEGFDTLQDIKTLEVTTGEF